MIEVWVLQAMWENVEKFSCTFREWRFNNFTLFCPATGDINDPNKLKAAAGAVNQKSADSSKTTETTEATGADNQPVSAPAQASEKTSQNIPNDTSSEEISTESTSSIKRSLDDSDVCGDSDSSDSKPQEKRHKHDNEVSNAGVSTTDDRTDEKAVSSTYKDTDFKSTYGASMKCNIPTAESSTNEESPQNLTSNKDTDESATSGQDDASSDRIKTSQDNDAPCNMSTSEEGGINTTEKDSEDTNHDVPLNDKEAHKDDHKESSSVADTDVNKENSATVTDEKKEEEEVEWADDDTYLQVRCEILVINILLKIWCY